MSPKRMCHITPPSRPPVRKAAGRPLLLALFDGLFPTGSFERAIELARLLDEELHIVQIIAGPWPLSSGVPEGNLLAIMQSAELAIQAQRGLRDWLAQVGPADLEPGRVRIRGGDFVRQVASRADEIDAGLIVIAPMERGTGKVATQLACTARRPVLVASGRKCTEAIVAATDLEDCTYPVLRMAATLGRRLHAPVVALHNVSPLSLLSAGTLAWPALLSASEDVVRARRERLEGAVRTLPPHAMPVVADQVDPADAILNEAVVRDVDLIIVGTRPRSWFDRWLMSSVAARVVNRAGRSVLVVPLDAPDQPGCAQPAWA